MHTQSMHTQHVQTEHISMHAICMHVTCMLHVLLTQHMIFSESIFFELSTHHVALQQQSGDMRTHKELVIVHTERVIVYQHVMGAMVITKPHPRKGGPTGARYGLI